MEDVYKGIEILIEQTFVDDLESLTKAPSGKQ